MMRLILIFLVSACMLYAQEDPNVMWTYKDASFSTYPAIHPNGNVLIGDRNKADVIELNGLTGELVRRIPFTPSEDIIVSSDGLRIMISHKVIDYESLEIINDNVPTGLYAQFLNPRNDVIVMKMSMGIVTFNINDNKITEYSIPTNQNSTTAMKVSNDGRFIAIAQRDFEDDYHTHFYLYDAQTMKLIRELEDVPAEGRTIEFIQFSENAKYVGYGHKMGGTPKGTFFKCEPPFTKWENVNYPIDSRSISFIKDEYAIICAGGAALIFDINSSESVYRTIIYAAQFQIFYNKIYNSLLTINSQTFALTSLNFDTILEVDNVRNKTNITIDYLNDIINISGIESISPTINLTINDIKGNLVYQNRINHIRDIIEIPVQLQNGVYLLHIQDGNKSHTTKFLVLE